MGRKPKGVDQFAKLLRPLSQVPKREIDQQAAKHEARKAAKKKRKK